MADYDDATMEVPRAQQNLNGTNAMQVQSSQSQGRDSMDEDVRDGPDDPWYMNMYLPWGSTQAQAHATGSRQTAAPASVSRSMDDDSDDDDCREEDMTMEREGDDRDTDARIHVPLKRQLKNEHGMDIVHPSLPPPPTTTTPTSNKRRRLAEVGEAASMAFYHNMPALTERQQAIVEYTAPSTFTPLFKVLGYTPFAVTWVMVMYVGHFLQTMVSTFGPETEAWRWKAWITPLYHSLIDTYVWNHSMITTMLLYPALFGDTAYWLAVFFVMGQQQLYLVVSLKTHYVKHRETLKDESSRHQIELRLVDCFLLYGLAALLFTLARVWSLRYLLLIGLVEFNLAPLYLVWAYTQRLDAATKRPTPSDKDMASNKETAVDTKKGQ